jgi:4-hydroxythreonine-4-phosphate dehydrogenase
VSKQAIQRSDNASARGFIGHTEWLQARDAARFSVMCFASEQLTTSLVTTHLPLARVPKVLTSERVRVSIVELAKFLRRTRSTRTAPHICVCSLNPHAGEGELFGNEERRAIAPGVEAARKELGRRAKIAGPLGAETAYRKAFTGAYDGVVAMYHDQATIPMKLVAFGDAVNVTLGLSIVRTSVDHGTGYDIAWRGVADEGGMLSALRLGARLVG